MRILKKFFTAFALFVLMLVPVYFFFPGIAVKCCVLIYRLSAGMEFHETVAGNYKWAYLEGGKGETILFIHGFGAGKDTWGKMLGAFSGSYRVIAPDLVGTNDSEPVKNELFTITQTADELDKFVKSLELGSFHIVGLSAGGAIAAYYASMHPDSIKSLSLIGPFGIQTDVISDFRKAYENGENPILYKTAEGFDIKTSYITLNPLYVPGRIKLYMAEESARTYNFYTCLFDHEIQVEGWDMLRNHLKGISCPVLVIYGDRDRVTDVSCMDVFKKEVKTIKPVILKEAGHVTYMDKPEETIQAISDFIKSYPDL